MLRAGVGVAREAPAEAGVQPKLIAMAKQEGGEGGGAAAGQPAREQSAAEPATAGKSLKVLYLHGYEEQVKGKEVSPKPSSLMQREDLEVEAPELLVWVTQWNSPLWQVLATPYFHFAIFCALCAGEVVVNHGHFTPETGLRLSLTRLPPVQWVSNATGIDVPRVFDDMWVPPVLWLGLLVIVVVCIIFRTEIMVMAVDRSVNTTYNIAKNAVVPRGRREAEAWGRVEVEGEICRALDQGVVARCAVMICVDRNVPGRGRSNRRRAESERKEERHHRGAVFTVNACVRPEKTADSLGGWPRRQDRQDSQTRDRDTTGLAGLL